MKNLLRVAAAVGVVGALVGAAGASAVGCSSSSGNSETGSDGGGDSATDANPEATPDVTMDTNGGDSEGVDTGTVESGVVDTGTVDSGGHDADGGAEGAASYAYFPTEVIQADCNRIETCCVGGNTSTFNMGACLTDLIAFGGFNGDQLYLAIAALETDGGAAVTFDQAKATQCLSDIGALGCGNDQDTAWRQVTTDCYGALVGQIAVNGTGCHGSIECAPGGYCSQGTCKPVLALGDSCTSNDQCEYRGTAPATAYCDYQYPNADAGSRTCVAAKTTGSPCGFTFYYPWECQTCVCNANTALCDTSQLFSDPGTPGGLCDSLAIKDAGGGG